MKKVVSIIIVIILAILLSIKFLLPAKKEEIEIIPTPSMALPTISDQFVIDLIPRKNKQSIDLTIDNIDVGIESIEYEITYLTGTGLPKGVLGRIKVDGKKTVSKEDIVLGTCSSGKCVYDTGVKSVELSLKFNTASGSSVFQKSYPL